MKLFFVSLGVLGAHLLVLAWMQVAQPVTRVAPQVLQIDLLAPALPQAPPPAPAPPEPHEPRAARQPVVRPEPPKQPPRQPETVAPQPAEPLAPAAERVVSSDAVSPTPPEPGAPAAIGTPQPANAAPGVAPNPAPVVHQPSSHADYLQNPPPVYPPLSQRLGEQGKVTVRVLIGQNGRALRADIARSSGFARLDQAALKAVLSWRYVAGTVNGEPQDMWFDVPVNFKLPD